jgi:hypothetical protein
MESSAGVTRINAHEARQIDRANALGLQPLEFIRRFV